MFYLRIVDENKIMIDRELNSVSLDLKIAIDILTFNYFNKIKEYSSVASLVSKMSITEEEFFTGFNILLKF